MGQGGGVSGPEEPPATPPRQRVGHGAGYGGGLSSSPQQQAAADPLGEGSDCPKGSATHFVTGVAVGAPSAPGGPRESSMPRTANSSAAADPSTSNATGCPSSPPNALGGVVGDPGYR